jgi:gamma-glutamylcyclotransferase (GGCT)/AIG2-like uncharacterized protein YtfP
MITAVFVYGTLQQGQCRHRLWPAVPLSIEQAWVHGALFDGPEYPAMTAGDDRVLGQVWTLPESEMERVLIELDKIEGTNQAGQQDLYRRVLIETWIPEDQPLVTAYTYLYATDPTLDGFTRRRPAETGCFVNWPPA